MLLSDGYWDYLLALFLRLGFFFSSPLSKLQQERWLWTTHPPSHMESLKLLIFVLESNNEFHAGTLCPSLGPVVERGQPGTVIGQACMKRLLLLLSIESTVWLITVLELQEIRDGYFLKRWDDGEAILQEMASFETFTLSYFETTNSIQLS